MGRPLLFVSLPAAWRESDVFLDLEVDEQLLLVMLAMQTFPWGRTKASKRNLTRLGVIRDSFERNWLETVANLARKGLVTVYETGGERFVEIVDYDAHLPSKKVAERGHEPCPSADSAGARRIEPVSFETGSNGSGTRARKRVQRSEEREQEEIGEQSLHTRAHEAATSAPPSRSSTFLEPSAADRNQALAAMSAAAAPLPNSVEAFGPEDAPFVRRWVQTLAAERSGFLGESSTLSAAEVYASVSRSLLALRDKYGSEKFQAGVERHVADRPQGFTNEWLSKSVDALGHRIRWAYEDAARQDRQAAEGGKVVPFQRPERECNDQPQGDLGTGHWELRAARLRAGVDEIAALLEQGDYEAKFKARALDSLWGQGTSMQIPDDQFGMGETRKLWVTVRSMALALTPPPRPSFSADAPEEGVA